MPQRTRGKNPAGSVLGSARAPVVPDTMNQMAHRLPSVVYFIRVKGLIKIGHSLNLAGRRVQLGAEWSDVLAIMPGGQLEESSFHDLFRDFAIVGREWFLPHAELYNLINEIRGGYGLKPVAA